MKVRIDYDEVPEAEAAEFIHDLISIMVKFPEMKVCNSEQELVEKLKEMGIEGKAVN